MIDILCSFFFLLDCFESLVDDFPVLIDILLYAHTLINFILLQWTWYPLKFFHSTHRTFFCIHWTFVYILRYIFFCLWALGYFFFFTYILIYTISFNYLDNDSFSELYLIKSTLFCIWFLIMIAPRYNWKEKTKGTEEVIRKSELRPQRCSSFRSTTDTPPLHFSLIEALKLILLS